MLTLAGPSRGFVVSDTMFFEINLKIKGDNITGDRDFSKGVIEHYLVPFESQPATSLLHSWPSTVELVCEPIPYPVAVTLDFKILNGQLDLPFKGKISAGTTENTHNHIVLYEYDDSKATDTHRLIGDGHLVVLTRKLVVVTRLNFVLDEEPESMIYVCFCDKDDEDKQTLVMLQHPDEEMVCSHGSYKMHLKVVWRPILKSPLHDNFEKRWRSVHMRSFMIP
ncbi:hypothetical protein VPH35_027400 [Triticum aestivum]|uniref:DUF6598 domain-containing protein n=1 Tax=Triticum turgidum subsp. durum TaxID=4567 RepID=A0A9R1PGA4_TRITD|nr:unnamed protein product [Triticum turgidum subsp. durum]